MLSKVVRRGVCWGLGLAGLAMAGAAHAQEQEASQAYGSPRHAGHEAVQLTLQGSLVDYQKQTVKLDKLEGSSIDPAEQKTSTTSFGVVGPALGVGIGYAWDQVLFGVRANLATANTTLPSGQELSATQVSLAPRLEYMFNLDKTRPFIAGLLGLVHASGTTPNVMVNQNSGSISNGKTEDSATAYAIGAAFGVHAFLNESVSLDPEFTVLYASGSGTLKDATEGVTNPASRGYSTSTVRVLFSLGLSGWFDTAGAPTPPPPGSEGTEAPPAPVAASVASDEPEVKPISADIHLPGHRRLYLQVSKDPARESVLVRLTEPRTSFVLAKCEEIAIFDLGGPIKFAARSHGEHYVTGRLPIHALEVLATKPDSTLSVCADQWQLDQQSREAVQAFLVARHNLLVQTGDSDASAAPPVPAPAPSGAPEAPVAPPTEPSAPPTTPTGAFPPSSEAAPPTAAPAPAPVPKATKPKQ